MCNSGELGSEEEDRKTFCFPKYKFWLVRPPSPSEFPMTFLGVDMDIFWNCTFTSFVSLQQLAFCVLLWLLIMKQEIL